MASQRKISYKTGVPGTSDTKDVPSDLGYATSWGGTEDVDEQAPLARKGGVPELQGMPNAATFCMSNSGDEADPY